MPIAVLAVLPPRLVAAFFSLSPWQAGRTTTHGPAAVGMILPPGAMVAKGCSVAGGAQRVGVYIRARRPSPLTPRRRHHRLTHSCSRRLGRSRELGLLRHCTCRQISCLGFRPASELATMWGGRKATTLDSSRRSQRSARGKTNTPELQVLTVGKEMTMAAAMLATSRSRRNI